jgi:hypothetical protein
MYVLDLPGMESVGLGLVGEEHFMGGKLLRYATAAGIVCGWLCTISSKTFGLLIVLLQRLLDGYFRERRDALVIH